MQINIYTVTHKSLALPTNDLFQPILVGNRKENIPDNFLQDDIENHIAEKNPNYCEITAMYWIWKNVKHIDYIGICHYRRYFNFIDAFTFSHIKRVKKYKNRYSLEKVCSQRHNKKIEKLLKDYDFILPKKRPLKKTMYNQYIENHKEENLKLAIEIIHELYPDYVTSMTQVFNKKKGYFYSMMITSKVIYDQYMTWLMRILFEVEQRIIKSGIGIEPRVFGFLAERLFNLYLCHHDFKIKEVQVIRKK
ncbi:uncharacterized protein DUF4422 [Aquimarina sp. MAR_2010_214]|uniref:DUF4422 domain-containing protein n=1 Tax=Aquimarina sp. MAR_2010_214 TaxID=1250026 RepID=UPI000C709719|nr:DUF4422 domain-containing protein [Aquimarina sp. MAR_2010_214]PKV52212.1 uncharacterized protein DUF4422 [Aquimarina sp. MAR_2010_214]